MLPTVGPEAPGIANPQRQLELFTHGGKICLRIGAVNCENSGTNRYTVELSPDVAAELASALKLLAEA
ncbi:MAG: hypothetical protein C0422_14790 [Alcaligenaceae bacterium]|nr:hypothetical protein [Alcaligenaceae bacterium]